MALHQELTLTSRDPAQYARLVSGPSSRVRTRDQRNGLAVHNHVQITLNGERFELDEPLSVTALLARLEIDPRRVAVEHNLTIVKRQRFSEVVVGEGDRVEIVNFVGGG